MSTKHLEALTGSQMARLLVHRMKVDCSESQKGARMEARRVLGQAAGGPSGD